VKNEIACSISRIIRKLFVVVAKSVVRDKLVRQAAVFNWISHETGLIYYRRACRMWRDLHDNSVKFDTEKEMNNPQENFCIIEIYYTDMDD
jgi:hypothetical protein